jgi:beta-phosphoglucomutase-like phosphatase (HAD superfamily)
LLPDPSRPPARDGGVIESIFVHLQALTNALPHPHSLHYRKYASFCGVVHHERFVHSVLEEDKQISEVHHRKNDQQYANAAEETTNQVIIQFITKLSIAD